MISTIIGEDPKPATEQWTQECFLHEFSPYFIGRAQVCMSKFSSRGRQKEAAKDKREKKMIRRVQKVSEKGKVDGRPEDRR